MAYAEPISDKDGLVEYEQFMGLRNNVAEDQLGPEDLTAALNVDINDALRIRRRKGHSAVVAAGVDRDVWSAGSVCLGVGSNNLKLISPEWTLSTLRSSLTPSRTVSYAAVGDRVFYSNGMELGCVQNGAHRTWGLTVPGRPEVAAGPGSLAIGKYQVAVTYRRSDGQESGMGLAATIELTSVGGISLSSIPVSTDSDVTYKIIYATAVNGQTLFRTGVIANAVTTFSIDEVRKGSSPATTQFLSPPPAGDFIAAWGGYMLVAKDARLYPSEWYAPELFDLRKSVPFLDKIVMIAGMDDGVWVGTGTQVIWLAGATPKEWEFREVANYGVVPYTLTYGDSDLIGEGNQGGNLYAFFATQRGMCVGSHDGQLTNLTQARYAYPIQERGAGLVRRHNGMAQFLVSLQGAETSGNIYS